LTTSLIDQYKTLDPTFSYFKKNGIVWSDSFHQSVKTVSVGKVKMEKLIGKRAHVPEIDPIYQPIPDSAEKFTIAQQTSENLLCNGPSGTGKTVGITQMAAMLNRPLFCTQLHEDTRSSDLFGEYKPVEGNKLEWFDGPVTCAWVTPGAVLLLDEINRCPEGVLAVAHTILNTGTKEFSHPDKDGGKRFFKRAPGVLITATANAFNDSEQAAVYNATRKMDEALVDRFMIKMEAKYPDAATEKKILTKVLCTTFPSTWNNLLKKGIDKTIIDIIKVAEKIRDTIKEGNLEMAFSVRSTLAWAKVYCITGDISEAAHLTVVNGRDPSSVVTIENIIRNVIGESYKCKKEKEDQPF